MISIRIWAAGSVVAALILLSPVIAFLIVVAAEALIDLLSEVGPVAVLDFLAAVIIGWILFRRMSSHPDLAVRSGAEEEPDEKPIAARPV